MNNNKILYNVVRECKANEKRTQFSRTDTDYYSVGTYIKYTMWSSQGCVLCATAVASAYAITHIRVVYEVRATVTIMDFRVDVRPSKDTRCVIIIIIITYYYYCPHDCPPLPTFFVRRTFIIHLVRLLRGTRKTERYKRNQWLFRRLYYVDRYTKKKQ